jgi:hypothetical protein
LENPRDQTGIAPLRRSAPTKTVRGLGLLDIDPIGDICDVLVHMHLCRRFVGAWGVPSSGERHCDKPQATKQSP